MSVASTNGGTPGMCTECGCLVEQGWERTHEEWHETQKKLFIEMLRIATTALDDAARLRIKILEMEGKAP